jgi:hypothetical protein
MSKHEKRLMNILTVDLYVKDIKIIIEDILTIAPDDTLIFFGFNAKDFREIKSSFYSSKEFLEEMCNTYTGRFVRMYALHNNISAKDINNIFKKTEKIIDYAADKLQKYYYDKLGLVFNDDVEHVKQIIEKTK